MMMGGGPPRGGGGGGGHGPGAMSASGRNVISRINDAPPDGDLSSSLFGQSTALAGGFVPCASGAAGDRKIELQLRFTF